MASQNIYEGGLALNGLANFIHGDLARDLANDIISLMSSVLSIALCSPQTRLYLRKKATLVSYKVL
jgi:AP-3 complex subunit delta-1